MAARVNVDARQRPRTKLLGVIASVGLSPETKPFAGLLAQRDHRYDAAVIFHTWPGDRDSATRFRELSRSAVVPIDFGWRPNPFGQRPLPAKALSRARFWMLLPKVRRMATQMQPDLVYSTAQKWDCFTASYVAQRVRLPQIIHLHYPIGWSLGRHVLGRLRTCDHVIAASDFIRDEALRHGVDPARVSVVRYPVSLPELASAEQRQRDRIDARRELGVPLSAVAIGMVARLDRFKGQIETIQAFSHIARHHQDAYLILVGGQLHAGSGLSPKELRVIADRSEFRERIMVTGPRSDVPRLLSAFDIFAHPSRHDASPNAVIEASSVCLPVVAWREGGVAEIVSDGETGLLAAPCDVVELAAHLDTLVSDPARAQAMGVAGRHRIASLHDPIRTGLELASLVSTVANRPARVTEEGSRIRHWIFGRCAPQPSLSRPR